MVVVSAPDVDNICEVLTHNPLTRAQGNPILLSLIGIHKECIVNTSESESNFWGGQHGWAYVAMGNQQYSLHYQIVFFPPRKPGRSPVYLINPTHVNIAVANWQHQNYLHDYQLVKKRALPSRTFSLQPLTTSGSSVLRILWWNMPTSCLSNWWTGSTLGNFE